MGERRNNVIGAKLLPRSRAKRVTMNEWNEAQRLRRASLFHTTTSLPVISRPLSLFHPRHV